MNKSSKWSLIFIFLLALILRLVAVERDSLWFDEAISYLTAQLSVSQIAGNVILDPHPPLYYLLLHGWYSVWDGVEYGRVLNVVLNVVLLGVVWLLARQWLDGRGSQLAAVGLISISPFHIFYSHELRMYTLLMLLTSLVVWAYWQARRTGGWWWVGMTITAVLAMYTHLFAAFVLLAIGLHAICQRHDRGALWRTVVVGVIVVVAFMPWLITLLAETDLQAGSLRPLARGGDADVGRNPIKLIITLSFLLFGPSTTIWYSALSLFLALATITVLLLEMRKVWHTGDARLLLPVLVAGCAISGPILIYYVRPFFLPERTMAAASPFLVLLFAWGITRRRTPLPALVGLTAVVMVVGTAVYLFGEPMKPPYRDAIQFVMEQAEPGDVILHTSDGSYLPALSYVYWPQHFLLAGDPDQRKPTAVYAAYSGDLRSWSQIEALGSGQLWIIRALEHSVTWQKEQTTYAANQYSLLDQFNFSGIDVFLYDLSVPYGKTCDDEKIS